MMKEEEEEVEYDYAKINSGVLKEEMRGIIIKTETLFEQMSGSINAQVMYLMGDITKPNRYSLRNDIINAAKEAGMMRLPITKCAVDACERMMNLDSDYDKLIEILTVFTGLREPKKKEFDSLIDIIKKAVQYARKLEDEIDLLRGEIENVKKEQVENKETEPKGKPEHTGGITKERERELEQLYLNCKTHVDYVNLINYKMSGLKAGEMLFVKDLEQQQQRFKGKTNIEIYWEKKKQEQAKKGNEQEKISTQQNPPPNYQKTPENQDTNIDENP